VIVTAADSSIEGVAADVSYIRQPRDGTLSGALSTLRSDFGVRSILCEGGPHLNSELFREGLVDELFLCVSPRIAGEPDAPVSLEGVALAAPVDLDLVTLHEAEDHLFFRYRVRR
jgi:riboflavin biosynthesis pyrimidine reductase